MLGSLEQLLRPSKFDKIKEITYLIKYYRSLAYYVNSSVVDTSMKICHEVQVREIQCQNIMMFGFLRNGVLMDSCRFFTKMLERNGVPWNSMISYFNDSGNTEFDVKLFAIFLIENVVVWTKMVSGLTPKEPSRDLDDECSSFVASSLGPFEVNESI